MKRIPRFRRGVFFVIILTFFVLVFITEATFRLAGFSPWNPNEKTAVPKNQIRLFVPDPVLGYKINPKQDYVEMERNGVYWFSASHSQSGFRKTGSEFKNDTLPSLWVLGCSFAYGWGVMDSSSFPAQLSARLPQWRIENYAVPGYGTLQMQLQLEQLMKDRPAPAALLLSYASFHNQRNAGTQLWKRALARVRVTENLNIPVMRSQLGNIEMERLEYFPWAGSPFSATINAIEFMWLKKQEEKLPLFEITFQLISKMDSLCRGKKIPFYVAVLDSSNESKKMIQRLNENEIMVADVSGSLRAPGMDQQPDDAHPSALGQKKYADNIEAFLKKQFTTQIKPK